MAVTNLVGQMLGQYQLRSLLGTGGMGAVYRGYQSNLRREVAVKVMSASLIERPEYAERFNREAQTVAALEHSHIVPIYDYGTENKITYVVMRMLTGGSLAERITYRPSGPSLGEIAEILRQLASALDYAHARGVIHRDIKANNVMFDDEGSAYLVDFGIAKLLDATTSLTSPSVTIGTPLYMAPEQWRGDKITPAADQYALGVLIYTLLTNGRPPFEAETPYALMHKHLNEPPTPIELHRADLPRTIRQVIERAIAKAPEARYPTAREFAGAFEAAISSFPSQPTGFFKTPLPGQISAARQSNTPAARTPQTPYNTDIGTAPVLIPPSNRTPPNASARTPTGATAIPQGSSAPPRTPTGGLPPLTNTAPIPRGGLRLPIVGIVALLVVLIGGVGIALFGRDILGGVTETATPPATATLTEIPIVIVPTTSDTATSVPSVTPTASATQTLTLTLTETPAPTFTPTPTDTPTFTPSLTLTPTETPSLTLTPSLTPTDTETPTATLTPTPTETPSPTPTATPATPIAFGVRPLIARVGPEPRFPVMATIAAELALDIIGISEDGQWIQVAFKDGSIGWIAFAAASLQTAGDLRLIPVALPPTDTPTATITPSVTPTPTLTLTPSDTPSPTNKPTVTPTFTETPSSTPIPSSTPTDMPSFTPSWTPSHTPTLTLTATATATFTETPTPTESPTFTLTPRPTPTPTRTRTPVPSRTPTPAYTFQIGETVVVFALDDDGLALRQRPSRSAGLMDLLPTRTILTVIGGPVESENLTWWELRMENRLTGWAVEEADGVRTLRASGDPSLSPTSVICPGGRLPTRMVVGDYARVLEDDARPLNIRSGAGTTFERIGQLLVNDVFLILDGPVCVGGLAWYRIQDNVNREGWIAEGDTAYFVEPVG